MMRMVVVFSLMPLLVGSALAQEVDGSTGREVYAARCRFCHADNGDGQTVAGEALNPPPPDFTSPAYWKQASPEQIREVIAHGRQGTAMGAFDTVLNAEEIEAVARYVEGFAPEETTPQASPAETVPVDETPAADTPAAPD